jgi:cysteinyl-tRNA synthetase
MDDDFNTPEAIAVLQGLARELNSARGAAAGPVALERTAAELRALGAVLGILKVAPEQWFRSGGPGSMADADIDERIQARLVARKAKNWAESDRIRDELAQSGVILEDKPGGATTWRRA